MGALVAGAAAILAAAAPAPALAGAPAQFVGTQWSAIPSELDMKRMGGARIQTYRHNFVWRMVEPREGGRYRWDRYDALMSRAARHRIRVMPVLVGSPRWANRDIHHPPRTTEDRRAYYRYVAAVAKRYGPGGEFWKTQPTGSARYAARYLQIWNEPNMPNWWNDRPSPADYAKVLRGAARDARRANPKVEIVAAGMPESRNPRVMKIGTFLRGLYRQPGARQNFDYVAVHPYARTPDGVMDIVERTRSAMNRARDRDTKIWVTEFGWASGGGHSDFSTSYAGQAAKLRQTYREMIRRRARLGIQGAIWYLYKDVPESVMTSGWQSRTGLRTRGDAAKPAWRELLRITGAR